MSLRACALLLIASMTTADADNGDTETLALPLDGWRLVTDGVMGGVSQGTLTREARDGVDCIALRGTVSTDNNGGFIQAARDLDDPSLQVAGDYDGIRLDVSGNGEAYNVHLRTADLWLPWQSYRASFTTGPDTRRLYLPFAKFTAYRTGAGFDPAGLRRIGIVAIGRDFDAELCVSAVAFYRARD